MSKVVAVAYSLFIVYASLGKYVTGIIPKDINGGDKIAHFGAYFVLVLVWSIVVKLNQKREAWKPSLHYVVIGGLLLGLLMEISQYVFTSYRQMDWLDMVANSVGVFLGYLLSIKFILKGKKQ